MAANINIQILTPHSIIQTEEHYSQAVEIVLRRAVWQIWQYLFILIHHYYYQLFFF